LSDESAHSWVYGMQHSVGVTRVHCLSCHTSAAGTRVVYHVQRVLSGITHCPLPPSGHVTLSSRSEEVLSAGLLQHPSNGDFLVLLLHLAWTCLLSLTVIMTNINWHMHTVYRPYDDHVYRSVPLMSRRCSYQRGRITAGLRGGCNHRKRRAASC
jgi:hypothetical protein